MKIVFDTSIRKQIQIILYKTNEIEDDPSIFLRGNRNAHVFVRYRTTPLFDEI
jgi:hypothetical protein